MLRVAAGLFLILHGLINGAIWVPPRRDTEVTGFGSQASWLFARVRPAVVALALLATSGFVFSGAAYLAQSSWWAPIILVGTDRLVRDCVAGAHHRHLHALVEWSNHHQRVDHLRSLEHRRGAALRAVDSRACVIPPGGQP